jgi:hypothetical protein
VSHCFHVGANDQKIPFPLTDEILITFLVDLGGKNLWFKNSRYKNGTTKARSLVFSVIPYTALQCDRCLVITT